MQPGILFIKNQNSRRQINFKIVAWKTVYTSIENDNLYFRTMAKPRLASHTSRDRLVFKEPGVHSSDDEEDGCDVGSEDGTSSNSSSHKHTSFDRHLVLVGKFGDNSETNLTKEL